LTKLPKTAFDRHVGTAVKVVEVILCYAHDVTVVWRDQAFAPVSDATVSGIPKHNKPRLIEGVLWVQEHVFSEPRPLQRLHVMRAAACDSAHPGNASLLITYGLHI
jgi:hypothetical protein